MVEGVFGYFYLNTIVLRLKVKCLLCIHFVWIMDILAFMEHFNAVAGLGGTYYTTVALLNILDSEMFNNESYDLNSVYVCSNMWQN